MFLEYIDPFVRLTGAGWLEDLTFASIIIRLAMALLCGGILGIERALKHHAAGFRTYTLVCIGSSVVMLTNQYLFRLTGSGDAARLGAQVISGIGFLGAGTIILNSRSQIKGLTTAAGLWVCACVGLGIGAGFYSLAVIAMLVIIIILCVLPPLESKLTNSSRTFGIHIEFDNRTNLKEFINFAREKGLHIISTDHNQAYSSSGLSVYSISLSSKDRSVTHKQYLAMFAALPYVNHVEEIKG